MKFKLYYLASLIFIVLGIGHIIAEFVSRIFLNPRDNALYKAMSLYHLNIFGFNRSIHEFMEGFSLTMGCLMVFYGTFNLLLLKSAREIVLESKVLNLFNAFVSVVIVILSIMYFHWPPIILFSVSAFFYLGIFFRKD